ncbi:MAG TPA: response regulator [Gammaproteobacteria bacterium]|nr:response regulator [Gammaproteobacteria bacterium]
MERTLLIVDDEENILSALTRLLRHDGYRILTAGSAQDGLTLLADNHVNVIITDQRMPKMTGTEFLSQVKELYPETIRIVLSGYTELKSVTDAINCGAIYKFFTKPWDKHLLRANIEEAFAQYELRSENERLARELQAANAELSEINQDLERRVEEKTREIKLNMHTLQISQEVLEHLPSAVLGVGDDGCVAVVNRMAARLLNQQGGYLVGRSLQEFLPAEVFTMHSRALQENVAECCLITLDGGGALEVCCCRLGQSSYAKGTIMVMTPQAGDVMDNLETGKIEVLR